MTRLSESDDTSSATLAKILSILAKVMVVVVALVIVGLLVTKIYFFIFFGGFGSKVEREFGASLDKVLKTEAKSVRIRDIVEFDWERVCVVSPYISKSNVENRLGFRYDYYDRLGWILSDSYWGLLFITKEQKVIPIRIDATKFGSIRDRDHRLRMCADANKAELHILRGTGPFGRYTRFTLSDP